MKVGRKEVLLVSIASFGGALVGAGAVLLTGCGCPELALDVAGRNRVRSEIFVEKMAGGETTRAVEQDFLRAQADAWRALEGALRGEVEDVD